MKPLTFILVVLASIATCIISYRYDACRPDQKGEIFVNRARFNRIEICDGEKWQPYKIEHGEKP